MTNVHLDKLRPLEMVGNVVLDDFLPAIQAEVSKELQPVLRKYCVTKICASVSALVPDSIPIVLLLLNGPFSFDEFKIRIRVLVVQRSV